MTTKQTTIKDMSDITAKYRKPTETSLQGYNLGINQIIKAIPSLKADKDSHKQTLSTLDKELISGSSIAPLYRLDGVKTKLRLTDEQVQAIIAEYEKPTAKQLQAKVLKLEKEKKILVTKLEETTKEIKAKIKAKDDEIKQLQASFWA